MTMMKTHDFEKYDLASPPHLNSNLNIEFTTFYTCMFFCIFGQKTQMKVYMTQLGIPNPVIRFSW